MTMKRNNREQSKQNPLKSHVLIYVEGKKTEYYFFNYFRYKISYDTVKLEHSNCKTNCLKMHTKIEQQLNKNPKYKYYDIAYIVYDRDYNNNTEAQLQECKAIRKNNARIVSCISIPCFEIVFLIYFNHNITEHNFGRSIDSNKLVITKLEQYLENALYNKADENYLIDNIFSQISINDNFEKLMIRLQVACESRHESYSEIYKIFMFRQA